MVNRDQLYLDRVHIFVPVLHQRQYLSWSKSPFKTEPQKCLQYAMWTIAACLSAQRDNIREGLYKITQQLLESLDTTDGNLEFAHVEYAQAWLLVAIYELLRTNYQRVWLSAGRCFRLIQLMRLYEIDSPGNLLRRNCSPGIENGIANEEKRRTFWMSYIFDRFLSMRQDWPLTLNEQVVSQVVYSYPLLKSDLEGLCGK